VDFPDGSTVRLASVESVRMTDDSLRGALLSAEAAAHRLARLQALTGELVRSVSAAEVARAVVEHGRSALGAFGAFMAVVLPGGREAELVGTSGYPDELVAKWRRFPLADEALATPFADAIRAAEPVVLESGRGWKERYRHLMADSELVGRQEALVCFPMTAHARTFGVLGLGFRQARSFDQGDRAFLEAVAVQAAQALERARLFEEERRARRDAEHARAEAESANRAKAQFLAVMSHELRTPLNAICGYADLLELGVRGAVTRAQAEDLRRIRRAGGHLLTLINDILAFARLEVSRVELAVSAVPLQATLVEALGMIEPQAQGKGIATAFGGCDPGCTVRADGDKLKQIMLNLLTNAVKFTDSGGRIDVSCAVEDDVVRIAVHDTGRGIAAHQLEAIFEPFVQVGRRVGSEEHRGVGLGLSISRDLARRMGGDLTAESTLGVGSTLTLTLPAGRDDSGRAGSG